jgi:hypothetical protein
MRPKVAPLLSGSIYVSADQMEMALPDKLVSFKGQELFLALKQQPKTVTLADGTTEKEPVLNAEFSMKRFGPYLGQFAIFECSADVRAFLTRPKLLFSDVAQWKEAGGYIECENAEAQVQDLKLALKGSVSLASTGIPEEGSFMLEINRGKGILTDVKTWVPLSPKTIKDAKKCGTHVRIPITLRDYNVFLDDVLLFDWQKRALNDDGVERVLSNLEEGKYSF